MTPWLLGTLVLLDTALCGFRAAAGRNPRIYLSKYYQRSIVRGAVGGLVLIAAFLGAGLALRASLGESVWLDLMSTAERMLHVYGVYATLVLLALTLYIGGSMDLSVLASVLILGPFTMIRPFVIIAGAAYALIGTAHPVVVLFAVSAASVMAGFEALLALGRPPWLGVMPEPDQEGTAPTAQT